MRFLGRDSSPAPRQREPRLFPQTGQGLGIETVRRQQVFVGDDGALRMGDANASHALVKPGVVRRIALERSDTSRPRLALIGDDGPFLVIALDQYCTAPYALHDPDILLDVTGAAAVAEALGVRIEPADDAMREEMRWTRQLAPTLPGPHSRALQLAIALGLLTLPAVMVLVALPALIVPLVLVATCLTVGPVLTIDRLRRHALALLESLPDGLPGLEDARRIAPTHPDAVGIRTPAVLYIGSRRIVEHAHGAETWFPGSAAGGVVAARVQPEVITLRDARGHAVGTLPGGWATEPTAFLDACEAVGIDVTIDSQHTIEIPGIGRLSPWRIGEGTGRGYALDLEEEGGISLFTNAVLFAVFPFLSVVGLLCGVWQPWAVIFGLPGLVLSTIHFRGYLRIRRWKRGRLPATNGAVPSPPSRAHSPAPRPRRDAERPQQPWPSDAAAHQDSLGDLTFPGLACWLPVPLDLPGPAQTIDAVLGLVEHPAPDDRAVAEQIVPQILAIAAATREDDPEDDVLSLAAWIHLEQDGRFTPDAVGWLRIIRGIGPGDDATTVLQMMTEGDGLLDVPTLTPLETGLGTAWSTVVRTRGVDRQHPVHEESFVIWVVPDPGFALTLSVQVAEPALTPRISHQLAELAEIVALD